MRPLPAIYVLRHGETEWNREGRCQGHLDAPLTPLGRDQAAQQGRILRDQVFAHHRSCSVRISPLQRTRTTWDIAAEIADRTEQGFEIEPRLAEVHMGTWQGRLRKDFLAEDAAARAHPNLFELSLNTPEGERFEALSARLEDLLDEITEPAICVTHGITSLVLRGLIRGLSRDEMAGQGHDQGIVYGLWDGQEYRLEDNDAD
ncbi:histidine phosphatase family protein [Jannaschia sp. CCS1]|uniref:histidine phosphatase family protein n=1 Tax=Jannaschia sp. (strain CCS1) TaxID=290400 RepID=UPI000053C480|nr:histidine phosphatase family protein [Jannaschia sp. CCS1]ABD55432.1 Phosphoglycerate mutase [Jannaschia sp. CCS1]